MEQYIGEGHEFPSRSELIRAALRDFLLEELGNNNWIHKKTEEPIDQSLFVVQPSKPVELPSPKTLNPICTIDEDGREHHYKIIKK